MYESKYNDEYYHEQRASNHIGDLFLFFENGKQINTKIDFYYDKNTIQIKNNKFVNSNRTDDLFESNKKAYKDIKCGLIYLVISNFIGDYTDTFQIFHYFEYYDISQIKTFKRDFYLQVSWIYFYATFQIDCKNINYSFLHFQVSPYPIMYSSNLHLYINETLEYRDIDIYYIPLEKYKNEIIMLKFQTYTPQAIQLLLYYSNYSILFPIKLNESLYFPVVRQNTKFIFIDIVNYTESITLKTNNEMDGRLYYFETNDFETIQSKIHSLGKSIAIASKKEGDGNYYITVPIKKDNNMSVVLEMTFRNDSYFNFTNSKFESEKSGTKITIIILIVVLLVPVICAIIYFKYCRKKEPKTDNTPLPIEEKDNDLLYEEEEKIEYPHKVVEIDHVELINNTNIISGDNNTINNNNIIIKSTDNSSNINSNNITNSNVNVTNNITNNYYNTTNNIINNNNIYKKDLDDINNKLDSILKKIDNK